MDALGHVNNVAYLRWYESARIAYFERTGLAGLMQGRRLGPILARQVIDYRLPLTYPDMVTVKATVTTIGTTSFVLAFRITSKRHDGAIAAEGDGVVVMFDYERSAKVPLSEEMRGAIHAYEATASA
jgi:acyl-CoA thioester hydrolase